MPLWCIGLLLAASAFAATIEEFRLTLEDVGKRYKQHLEQAEGLAKLRSEIFDNVREADAVAKKLRNYLKLKEQSILQTRETIDKVEKAIEQTAGLDDEWAKVREVAQTYFEDSLDVVKEFDSIQADASKLFPELADGQNPLVLMSQRARRTLTSSSEKFAKLNETLKNPASSDADFQKFLKGLRVLLATRQQCDLYDYKITCYVADIQEFKGAVARLEKAAQDLDPAKYLTDLAWEANDIAAWTAGLKQLVQWTPEAITTLRTMDEEARKQLWKEILLNRPRSLEIKTPDGATVRYYYERQQDRYFRFGNGQQEPPRVFAPCCDKCLSGRYVRRQGVGTTWVCQNPLHGKEAHVIRVQKPKLKGEK